MKLAPLALLALAVLAGCTGTNAPQADIERAKDFRRFPLYWAGERFRDWHLAAIDGLDYRSPIITFIYGGCTPHDGDEPSCSPPLQIQVSASCSPAHSLENWTGRRIRGAPVGTVDSAPVLYARGAEIKVYRGEESSPRDPIRALRTLRSVNRVPPVIGPEDPIPPCSD
jgi:hypothetical protein